MIQNRWAYVVVRANIVERIEFNCTQCGEVTKVAKPNKAFKSRGSYKVTCSECGHAQWV